MARNHHGFAFAFNDGNHSSGSRAMEKVLRWYPPERFARNVSYPAFANSSIDDELGSGDPADGDLEGGINLGFVWTDPVDEPARWSLGLSNELSDEPMTVDVTPRRCQRFRPKPGQKFRWESSTGQRGEVVADEHGRVTLNEVRLLPGRPAELTISL
jgi:hypothetical protein